MAVTHTGIIFSNTIRGISSSLLNAFVCFAFTALNSIAGLKSFVIFFTLSNLLMILLNWGLKDYSVKLFAAAESPKDIFSKLFSLRLSLFVISGLVLCFAPLGFKLLACIFVFSFFKFINNTIESFSILNNKNAFFAVVDLLCFLILVICYVTHSYFSVEHVFYLMIVSEVIKTIIGLILFSGELSFKWIDPTAFLKETINYFLVAFFSFLLSKADFYISSLYLSSKAVINYHIYSSLIGLSQVIITSFFSKQMVNWFKSKEDKFLVNMPRFVLTSMVLSLLALPCFYLVTLYFYKFTVSVPMLVLVFFNLLIYSFILLEIYLNTHQNKHRVILLGVLISSIVNIILSFILIRYFETLGAILANIISLFTLYLYFKFSAKYTIRHAT